MSKARARETSAPAPRFDLAAMRDAVRDFLVAAGMEVEGTHLEGTPERVARAWRETFLDGYERDPAGVFEEAYPAPPGSGMVLLKGVPFHGLCPHHLIPYHGRAHLAYVPKARLASLSSLPRLLDCFAHRLEIQETVTLQVAEALMEHLGAEGAAVVLETNQLCMTMRSPERRGAVTVTRHFAGSFANNADLRLEFLGSVGRSGRS